MKDFRIFLFITLILIPLLLSAQIELPTETSQLFSGSGNCESCHVSDGVIMFEDGEDISPTTLWRSTMMANSSKDPLWMAKAAIEMEVFPQHAELINDRCTVCHAASGFTEAIYGGSGHYTISELQSDPLARDGVTCTACHQIQNENLGQSDSYSGGYQITDAHTIFGPYTGPLTGPMYSATGYLPEHAEHIQSSALCATCHTLFTPSLNHEGEVIGSFAEQTPFLEWLNSSYYEDGISCQECHMPRAANAQDIALRPPWHTEARSPFWNHEFAGGNGFMLRMFRDHQENLGLTASFLQFEDTRSRTEQMLAAGIELQVGDWQRVSDSLYVNIHVRNLTGHKFPSGIPLRRAWLHVTAYDNTMQVIFESGGWNEHGEIAGLDDSYEPHYNVLNDEDHVQVYEGIMGDVDSSQTYTLLKAVSYLKDNRLPPQGFLSTVSFYDTIAVIGLATQDANFNRDGSTEGTGEDIVQYRLPATATSIEFELCYQSITPRLVEYFEEYDLPEANNFTELYSSIANEPIIVAEAFTLIEMDVKSPRGAITPKGFDLLPVFPNPFNGETSLPILMQKAGDVHLIIYDKLGRVVSNERYSVAAGMQQMVIRGNDWSSGHYYARVLSRGESKTARLTLVK